MRGGPDSWYSFLFQPIHLFSFSLGKYALRIYYAPGPVLRPEEKGMSKIPDMIFLYVMKFTF